MCFTRAEKSGLWAFHSLSLIYTVATKEQAHRRDPLDSLCLFHLSVEDFTWALVQLSTGDNLVPLPMRAMGCCGSPILITRLNERMPNQAGWPIQTSTIQWKRVVSTHIYATKLNRSDYLILINICCLKTIRKGCRISKCRILRHWKVEEEVLKLSYWIVTWWRMLS